MEDSGSRLLARQDFPHLSDAHWATLEKMVSLLGVAAFAGFPKLPAELQRERVERFDKYESSLIAHGAGAGARATTSGRAGAPTCKGKKSDKVTSAPKAEASNRDADSAAEDKVPQVFDVFTGEPKVGEVLTPLPTVAELLELEELSYVEFMDSLKAGELAEVVLLRPEGSSLELNSSSVMDPDVYGRRTNL
ncbi:hypothetical protein PF002_g27836 [Phytophthora fragariae]|uniref:Uncharacterized protein n=1 Tax=Phytophthora fragariae TaxID=53985 RepID=A0A6A3WGD2_9STRA|nr:hypothetical protein PF011_g22460 [Phytophthora fragariae]KAE9179349.1 hypothetical protein PF002_g27836 [Phytophthora fragariae]